MLLLLPGRSTLALCAHPRDDLFEQFAGGEGERTRCACRLRLELEAWRELEDVESGGGQRDEKRVGFGEVGEPCSMSQQPSQDKFYCR